MVWSSVAETASLPVWEFATGAAFGGLTVILKVCAALSASSLGSLGVPPSSLSLTVTVAVPLALEVGV